ncbi:putative gnat family protein [Botrytis fragariae]|uniref:Putative gnat family protein n=1 Tax=Botrytis fragariae TaxID=1964551 RepID=A0A8H6EPD7_9HELO|nr:putative gnat family protein [Botrytis fragariae]KAF5879315.1 putative gnat family protein [Botrytis fragariae]
MTTSTSSSSTEELKFYTHRQETISGTLIPSLYEHLPYSNPIYSRMLAPHNTPSRHCLFAATFPPHAPIPEFYTIIFSDRSRKNESQIWVFNPLIMPSYEQPLSNEHASLLSTHLKLALVHHKFSNTSLIPNINTNTNICPLIPYHTRWNLYLIHTARSSNLPPPQPPASLTTSRVPASHLNLVISTSTVPREPSTLLAQPSLCLLTPESEMVAWAFIGIDGTLATLYVLPSHRGLGLATYVARELIRRFGLGEFADLGFNGSSGFVHSDVKEGNKGSEGVMRALGGKRSWESSYLWVDCAVVDEACG